jgi:hypothetical protein
MDQTETNIPMENPVIDNISKGETKENIVVDNISKSEPTENIVHQEPPRYGFLNPLALNQTNNFGPIPNPYPPQPQWAPMGNFRNPSNMYASPLAMNPSLTQIDSYKVWSILNIFFCCLCLGFVACYYSSGTEEAIQRGDIQRALNASKNARTFNIITTIVGIILITFYILMFTGTLGSIGF